LQEWINVRYSPFEERRLLVEEELDRARGLQEIVAIRNQLYGRMLILDGVINFAEKDERQYHEFFVHSALSVLEDPKEVLIIGDGDGGALREVLRYDVRRVTLVDIDEAVIKVSSRHLGTGAYFADPRTKVVIRDARSYIAECEEKFDAVLVCVPPPAACELGKGLYGKSILGPIKRLIKPGGVLAMQSEVPDACLSEAAVLYSRLSRLFKHVVATQLMIPSFGQPISILFCSDTRRKEELSIPLGVEFTPVIFASASRLPRCHARILAQAARARISERIIPSRCARTPSFANDRMHELNDIEMEETQDAVEIKDGDTVFGKEPTLCPWFYEIRADVTVRTNARMLSYGENVQKLGKSMRFIVPLADEAFPGVKEAFQQSLRGIENLQDSGHKVTVEVLAGADPRIPDGADISLRLWPGYGEASLEHALKQARQLGSGLVDFPFCIVPQDRHEDVSFSEGKHERQSTCDDCDYGCFCKGAPAGFIRRFGSLPLAPIISLPKELMIEVTHKCDKECEFCFHQDRGGGEMDSAQIMRIIDDARSIGIKAVRFTGGEPGCREDIGDIIAYAKGLSVGVNTNGLLLQDNMLDHVSNVLLPVHNDSRHLDDPRIKRRIKDLRSKGVIVGIGTVATSENIRCLDKIHELVHELEPDYWEIYREVGAAVTDAKELVDKLSSYGGDHKIRNSLPFCSYDPDKVRAVCDGARFDDAHIRMFVDPKGFANPHYAYGLKEADVLKLGIMACWNHPSIRRFRHMEMLPDDCRACVHVQECKGGNRLAAYRHCGSFSGLDPMAAPHRVRK